MSRTRTVALVAAIASLLGSCAAQPASPDAGTRLTVGVYPGTPQSALEQLDLQITAFESDHPGIDVQRRPFLYSPQVFVAELAGGTAPDVFVVPLTDARLLVAAGQVADLGDGARLGLTGTDPAVSSAGRGPDGHWYAVPVEVGGPVLRWSRRLFAAAGLDPDEPPTSWADVRQKAARVTAATGVAGFGLATASGAGGRNLVALAAARGGDVEPDGTPDLDMPAVRDALAWLHDARWTDTSMGDAVLRDGDDVARDFAAGRLAMYLGDGGYDPATAVYGVDPDDVAEAPVPLEPGGKALAGGAMAVVRAGATPAQAAAALAWIGVAYPRPAPTGVPLAAEPSAAAPDIYEALDAPVQAVLTERDPDLDAALSLAEHQARAAIATG